ncbi:MAG: hypothetical protein FJ137_05860 [Deltaproteobacteria bacterium]|nr:hypothetical protein [Deltaproteobacteria bacterium]
MHPSQPIQPVAGDPRAWPASRKPARPPFGVALDPSDILRRTFALWREDAVHLGLVTALPYVTFALAVVAAVGAAVSVTDFGELGALQLAAVGVGGGLLLAGALFLVASYGGAFLVVEERLRGEPRSTGAVGALLSGLPFLRRLSVVYLLGVAGGTTLLAPALASGGLAVAQNSVALGLLGLFLGVVGLVAAAYGVLRLLVVGPVIVAEDVGVSAAIARSLDLTRGRVGHVLLVCVVFVAVLFVVNSAMAIVSLVPLLGLLAQCVGTIAVGSLQTVFLFVLYAALVDREAGLPDAAETAHRRS